MTIDLTNPAWPYLVFAEQLNNNLAGYAKAREQFASYQAATVPMPGRDPLAYATALMETNTAIMSQIDDIFSAARITDAFGNASHPSHEAGIRSVADDFINKLYAKLLDWSLTCFGSDVPTMYQPMFRAMGNLMSRPLRQIEEFCADVSSRAKTIDEDLRANRAPSVNFSLAFTPTIDDLDMRAYNESLSGVQPVKRGLFRRR